MWMWATLQVGSHSVRFLSLVLAHKALYSLDGSRPRHSEHLINVSDVNGALCLQQVGHDSLKQDGSQGSQTCSGRE